MNILNLVRPDILALKPYSSARSEKRVGSVWLDANENAFYRGDYYRYPEPQPDNLKKILANLYEINTDNILMTRGSDEGIDLLIRTFCRAGKDSIMICPPTYGMYEVASKIQGAEVITAPLNKITNFSLDLRAISANWQDNIKMIFLCSPNNPTGNVLERETILKLCREREVMVVVDEAYIEYAEEPSLKSELSSLPNLIILRTLSKAYGLAGARCGVLLGSDVVVDLLKKVIAPYPISIAMTEVVTKTLLSQESASVFKTNVLKTQQEKIRLYRFLKQSPLVKKVWKSETNFLLFEAFEPMFVMNALLVKGIVIRDRSHDLNLENCLRITVGNEMENNLLIEALKNA